MPKFVLQELNMEFKKLVEEKSKEAWKIYMPGISIDCAVFAFQNGNLNILLTKVKDQDLWGLPGGYIKKEETVTDAASRILKDRTGAQNIYLQQFRVFGDLNRSEDFFSEYDDSLWHKQRFVSIGFYALVDYSQVQLKIDDVSNACEWVRIDALPSFMMDHQDIFDHALITLRKQLNYKPIGYNLLPDNFTMPELQKLYEIILNKKLNRGNFYRKMTGYDILEKLEEQRKGGAHKSPNLYKFNLEKYNAALKEGFKEGW